MGTDAMDSDVPRAGQSFRSVRARAARMYDRSAVLPMLQISGQRVFHAAQLMASTPTRSLNLAAILRLAFHCTRTLAVALLLTKLDSRVLVQL